MVEQNLILFYPWCYYATQKYHYMRRGICRTYVRYGTKMYDIRNYYRPLLDDRETMRRNLRHNEFSNLRMVPKWYMVPNGNTFRIFQSTTTQTSLTKLKSSYATSKGCKTALQLGTAERALSSIINPCSEKGLNDAHGWHTLK